MLAIVGFAIQEFLTKVPVVEETPPIVKCRPRASTGGLPARRRELFPAQGRRGRVLPAV